MRLIDGVSRRKSTDNEPTSTDNEKRPGGSRPNSLN